MNDSIRIAIDAFGCDNAPAAPVDGAFTALDRFPNIKIILVGKEEILKSLIDSNGKYLDRVEIVDAKEVIVTGEHPVKSIQEKKNSSLVTALRLVRNGEADAVISGGNTGSVLVGGQVIVRKEKGVLRAPLAPLIPTVKGVSLLIDCGANVDARPEHLHQFAYMGQAYMSEMLGIPNPKVALANIGAEEEKGNALSKETYQLLKNDRNINFIGNIEGNGIPMGEADVIVTEAFAGNLILKTFEGVSKVLLNTIKEVMMTNAATKIGAVMIKGALKERLAAFDSSSYGGAPLLGLRSLVVKVHGNSGGEAFANAVKQCVTFVEKDLNGIIKDRISNMDGEM